MAENSPNNAVQNNSPKGYKPKLIERAPSFLTKALKNFTESGTRGQFERHSVEFQCKTVLGPVGPNRICWLCGFPIGQLLLLQNDKKKRVFNLYYETLDKGTCEHVLPVKLAHGLLELLYLGRDPIYEPFLHTEYEYAHNYCNFVKAHNHFISLPLESTDFCDLTVPEGVVDEFLRMLFYTQRGAKGSSQYSIVTTTYKGNTYEFINPVQAYCFATNPTEFLADPDAFYSDVWFPRTKKLILDKMNRLIGYIKEFDKCASENLTVRGSHFRGLETRLREGLPPLARGLGGPQPNFLESKFPKEFKRYQNIVKLQRMPSAEALVKTYKNNERLQPFRTPSFSGYTMNISRLFKSPGSRPSSRETKKGKRTKKTNSNLSNESSRSSPSSAIVEAQNAAVAALAHDVAAELAIGAGAGLEAAGAGAGAAAASASAANLLNSDEEAAVAAANVLNSNEEAAVAAAEAAAAKPKLKRLTGSRKLTNYFPSSLSTRTRSATRKNQPKLFAETRNNGIYLSGNTFASRNLIKPLGGIWKPELKKWVVPLGTNLSTLPL